MQYIDKRAMVVLVVLGIAILGLVLMTGLILSDLADRTLAPRPISKILADAPERGNQTGEEVVSREDVALDHPIDGVSVWGDWVYFYTLVRTAPHSRDIVIERMTADRMVLEPVLVIEWETDGVPNVSWFEVTEAGHFRFFLWVSHARFAGGADSRALVEFDRAGREVSRREIVAFDVVAGDGGQIVDRILEAGDPADGDSAVLVSTRMGRVYIFGEDGNLRGALEAGRGQMGRMRDGRAAYVGTDSGLRLIDAATGGWGETLHFPAGIWVTGVHSAGQDAPFDLYVEGLYAGNRTLMGYSMATGDLIPLVCWDAEERIFIGAPWNHFAFLPDGRVLVVYRDDAGTEILLFSPLPNEELPE